MLPRPVKSLQNTQAMSVCFHDLREEDAELRDSELYRYWINTVQ